MSSPVAVDPARAVLLACAALTLLAGGCAAATQTSAGSFSGPDKAVAQSIDDWSSAASKRDAKHICQNDLAQALVARLKASGGCEAAIKRQLDDADTYNVTVQPKGIQISGNSATANVKTPVAGKDHVDTLQMVKEGTGWRIAGVDGSMPVAATPAPSHTGAHSTPGKRPSGSAPTTKR